MGIFLTMKIKLWKLLNYRLKILLYHFLWSWLQKVVVN